VLVLDCERVEIVSTVAVIDVSAVFSVLTAHPSEKLSTTTRNVLEIISVLDFS
jgi:hypothetical protein